MPAAAAIFERLKNDITSGRYPINELLDARSLSEEYQMSTAPIREALIQLSAVGLVMRQRNRGYYVSSISKTESEFFYRQIMQAYICGIARLSLTPSEQESLELICQSLRSASRKDLAFYNELFEYLQNLLFTEKERDHINNMKDRAWFVRINYLQDKTAINKLIQSHILVLNHIRNKEFNQAGQEVKSLFDQMIDHLENYYKF